MLLIPDCRPVILIFSNLCLTARVGLTIVQVRIDNNNS
jgi:hypothetical protein